MLFTKSFTDVVTSCCVEHGTQRANQAPSHTSRLGSLLEGKWVLMGAVPVFLLRLGGRGTEGCHWCDSVGEQSFCPSDG